jgi:ribosomal protein L9
MMKKVIGIMVVIWVAVMGAGWKASDGYIENFLIQQGERDICHIYRLRR